MEQFGQQEPQGLAYAHKPIYTTIGTEGKGNALIQVPFIAYRKAYDGEMLVVRLHCKLLICFA